MVLFDCIKDISLHKNPQLITKIIIFLVKGKGSNFIQPAELIKALNAIGAFHMGREHSDVIPKAFVMQA
jgi:hypothetical protein